MKALLQLFNLGNDSQCKENAQIIEQFESQQPTIEFGSNGTVLSANQVFADALGVDVSSVTGQRFEQLFTECLDSHSSALPDWNTVLSGGVSGCFSLRVNGMKPTSLQGIFVPLRGDDGNVLKVTMFGHDISEISEGFHHAQALNSLPSPVMLCGTDGLVNFVNRAYLQLVADNQSEFKQGLATFCEHQVVGASVSSLLPFVEDQGFLTSAKAGRKAQTNLNLGKSIFSLTATSQLDSQGNIRGTCIEWQDKTLEFEQAAKALKVGQENTRIKLALDICDTSVMIADEDLNVVYINRAVEKMMKARESEIQASLPQFSVDNLIGTCVDSFHANVSHQRQLLAQMTSVYTTNINISGLTFGLIATPMMDAETGDRIGTVVEWSDKTEALQEESERRVQEEENTRVKQALDKVTANIMIADTDANIIYLNNSAEAMMKNAESDIRKDLKSFDASKLLGTNIDGFHKNPAHQRNILATITGTYNGSAKVGGRSFGVIANPVYMNGDRVGTVVEWDDKTAELAIEDEIDQMVDAAKQGDFTKHLSTDGKEGFSLKLSRGLNDLVGTVEVALNDILRIFGAMAKGDLSERITRDYEGSFAALKKDANITADKLTEIIQEIREATSHITVSAEEIAQGNADLSQRTEEQASSLEETASSMEEMTSTVKQSADNADEASKMALQAQSHARDGGSVVQQAVVAMDEINTSSKKISDIIGVIDEIAFQTNLLALNAAVEAARAGEQGRGFAVVAGEVRNLAQRSAAAAKEIKDLIRDSVDKVGFGTSLVNQSGEALAEIVGSVDQVTVMMEQIAAASREQTGGIEQVNTAITQMDEMTQQNAALVEQATAAAEAMAHQSRAMKNSVNFFGAVEANGIYSESPSPSRSSTAQNTSAGGARASSFSTPKSSSNVHNFASKKSTSSAPAKKASTVPNKAPIEPTKRAEQPQYDAGFSSSDDEWEDF